MASSIFSVPSDDPDLRELILASLAVECFLVVFVSYSKVYDLSTAAVFAFSLGFLARQKFGNFYALYPIGCLNRETMFLLTAFFAVHYFWRMRTAGYLLGLAYQGSAFAGIRLVITKIFEDNPGQPFYFWPLRVLTDYASRPIETAVLILVVAVLAYAVVRRWSEKPVFLRSACLVLGSLLIVLHLAMGMAFEIRVFAEVYPVFWVLLFIEPTMRFL